MAFLDNRYLKKNESDFVALISSDIENFIDTIQGDSNCIVVFPPVPNRLRFLIHKTVEDFPDVCSFSIGIGDQRRTVVCLQEAVIRQTLKESASSASGVDTGLQECQHEAGKKRMDSDSIVCVRETCSLRQTRKSRCNASFYVPLGRRTQSSAASGKSSRGNMEAFSGESVIESKPSLLRHHHSKDHVECGSHSTKPNCGSTTSISTDDQVKRLRVDILNTILPTATELKPVPSESLCEHHSSQAHVVLTEKYAKTGTEELASPELKLKVEKPSIILDAFEKCEIRDRSKLKTNSGVIAESEPRNTVFVNELKEEKTSCSDCTATHQNVLPLEHPLSVESTKLLDPQLMKELVSAVGEVDILMPPSDYGPYILTDIDLNAKEYRHLVEIYDFPPGTITRDLLVAFRMFQDDRFDIKWVDNTHAIGRFSSAEMAEYAVEHFDFCDAKLRAICSASVQTKYVAKQSSELVEPYKPRPETLVSTARNMVTGALGLRRSTYSQQQETEKIRLNEARGVVVFILDEARERKRQSSSKTRKNIKEWDGKLGRCAMDME